MTPTFKWSGNETNKEGIAEFKIGNMTTTIPLNDFSTALMISKMNINAYEDGIYEGIERVSSLVKTAMANVK
jgi:hypothetical protein